MARLPTDPSHVSKSTLPSGGLRQSGGIVEIIEWSGAGWTPIAGDGTGSRLVDRQGTATRLGTRQSTGRRSALLRGPAPSHAG